MKKYIAFAMSNGGNSNQNCGIQTKEKATEWDRNHVAKNSNMKVYVCEVISVASRPEPVVIVQPFEPVVEELSVNHS